MNREELFDALDGLRAYDGGCTDSGIHDELLRSKVKKQLQESPTIDKDLLIFVHTYFDPEKGYTFEDVIEFTYWLDQDMGFNYG